MPHKTSFVGSTQQCKSVLFALWLALILHLIYANLKSTNSRDQPKQLHSAVENSTTKEAEESISASYVNNRKTYDTSFGILFAEAGKKKKKEKSEVVVISVQNLPAKGHGGMYPIFVPSCGGGHGGYGGYGRRKRSIAAQVRPTARPVLSK